jgi:hypothetical protein
MKFLRVGSLGGEILVKSVVVLSMIQTVTSTGGWEISAASAATQNASANSITGPYQSGNLSVFMIHGKDQSKGQTYLTLQEALAQKKVVVHETGNVNTLSVDNLSGSVVFIQGGDIVKGGRQDRTMQQDMLLQPKAMNVSLPAFCVEHGRWSGRGGGESDRMFESANYALAGKDIKLAAKKANDQEGVWQAVSKAQSQLDTATSAPVEASASPTSYQLTLENKNVKQATDKIVQDLGKMVDSDKDVIGYAFAINGKVNSADVYASHDLFKKLWPKMLNASAVEAIAEGSKKSAQSATVKDVRKCLDDAEQAPKSALQNDTQHASLYSRENARDVVFCTIDKDNSVEVHKNYMNK